MQSFEDQSGQFKTRSILVFIINAKYYIVGYDRIPRARRIMSSENIIRRIGSEHTYQPSVGDFKIYADLRPR